MSTRSLRARSGSATAFLFLFILVCAFSTLSAYAAGSYVAALPDDELRLEVDLCGARSSGVVFLSARSACLVTSMKTRWMKLYNRAIDTLNKDVNLDCDETHAIFDNTSDQIRKELDRLSQPDKPILTKDHRSKLASYAEQEIFVRLTNGRGARDNSCTPASSSPNGGSSRTLTNNTSGTTSNPANPPSTPTALPRVTGLTAASEPTHANTHTFSGPRVANANVAGSCANRASPVCENALMGCLRACNSSANVDSCNAECQRDVLSCKGCGE